MSHLDVKALTESFNAIQSGLMGMSSIINGAMDSAIKGKMSKEEALQIKKEFEEGNVPESLQNIQNKLKEIKDKYGDLTR